MYFLYINNNDTRYGYGTLKEVFLRRERGKKENNERDEPNWGYIVHIYGMPLYN
jgi:hypothetical protein